MKLVAALARSLQAHMQAELRALEQAAGAGTRDAGRGLKAELRRQVGSAGLGQRLATAGATPTTPIALSFPWRSRAASDEVDPPRILRSPRSSGNNCSRSLR
jgi:hypothetical protein